MFHFQLEFGPSGTEAGQIGNNASMLNCTSSCILDFERPDLQHSHAHVLPGNRNFQQIHWPQQQRQQQICDNQQKKIHHNAYERERRKKVNDLYQNLDSLMSPSSSVSDSAKKRKNGNNPAVLQRAIKFIPQLQRQISELQERKRQLLNLAMPGTNSLRDKGFVEAKGITVSTEGTQTVMTVHLSANDKRCVFPLLAFLDEIHDLQVLSASVSVFADSAWTIFHIQNHGSLDAPVDLEEKIEGFLKSQKIT